MLTLGGAAYLGGRVAMRPQEKADVFIRHPIKFRTRPMFGAGCARRSDRSLALLCMHLEA